MRRAKEECAQREAVACTFRTVHPGELAAELEISGRTLRRWLRDTYPRSASEKGSQWDLTHDQVAAAREHWAARDVATAGARRQQASRAGKGRDASDEVYVVDLFDEILGEKAHRQHRFTWLRGDAGRSGRRAALPVDGYYPDAQVVVEYWERQHFEANRHFDKPDVLTVSGVHRGEQRRVYDRRREAEIPAHGLRLVIVTPFDLDSDSRGRLRRSKSADREQIRALLRRA